MQSKIITILLLVCFIKMLSVHAEELPPILEYYPGCEYQIVDLLVEKGSVSTSGTKENLNREYEQDLAKILTKLQLSAAEKGADALIITDLTKSKRIKDRELSEVTRNSVYQYSAEAIKFCVNENKSLRRPTSYDQHGIKGHTLKISQIKTEVDVALVIREMPTLQSFIDGQDINPLQFNEKARLKNKDISLSGTIYGVSLGASRAQVLREFGYPSAEFKLITGIESLLYGRRHWMHFKQDKLISVEFTDKLLSYESLNLIQALDEFDKFEWLIEDKIKLNTSIEEVLNVFKDKDIKEDSKKVTVDDNGTQLNLVFDTEYDPFSSKTKKYLVGFTLNYKHPPVFNAVLTPVAPLKLDNLIDAAKAGLNPNLDAFRSILAEPVGRIFADQNTYFDIYDNHMMLKYKNMKLLELSMREEVFKTPRIKSPKVPWKLTEHIFEGAQVKDIRQHYAGDLNLMFGKGSIDYPKLNIRLLVDGDDESAPVYASDFIFFNP